MAMNQVTASKHYIFKPFKGIQNVLKNTDTLEFIPIYYIKCGYNVMEVFIIYLIE